MNKMGYTWTNGEVITAEKLNNIGGGGIFDCVFSLGENVSCDKTAEEITQAYLSGQYINAVLDFSAAPPKRALGVDCDTDSYGTHVQAEFLVVIDSGALVDIMIIWNPAYERWEVITAEKLNQTGGIRVVALEGDGTNYTLDITPKEITSLIRKGIVSLIFAEGSGGWSVLQLIGMNTLGGDYVLATNTTHTFALAETEDTYFHGPVSTGPSK